MKHKTALEEAQLEILASGGAPWYPGAVIGNSEVQGFGLADSYALYRGLLGFF